MDVVCLLAAVFFFTTNLLKIVSQSLLIEQDNSIHASSLTSLDPDTIQQSYTDRQSSFYQHRGLSATIGFFDALSWITLCVPILQLAWILSRGGRRKIGLHLSMGALVIGATGAEMICRAMMVGLMSTSYYIASTYNMNSWYGANTNDGTGWKVLEMSTMIGKGMLLWMDSLEWLALSAILTLLYISVRTEKSDDVTFSSKFTILGLVIAVFSTLDFISSVVLRLDLLRGLATVVMILTFINSVLLIPIWLIVLGRQLPRARTPYDDNNATHFRCGNKIPVHSIANEDDNDDNDQLV